MNEYKIPNSMHDISVLGNLQLDEWSSTFYDKRVREDIKAQLSSSRLRNFKTAFLVKGGFAGIYKVQVDNDELPFILKLFTKTYDVQDEYHSYLSNKLSKWDSENHPLSKYLVGYQYYPAGYLDWSTPQKEAPFALMESVIESQHFDLEFIKEFQGTDTLRIVTDDFLQLMRLFDKYGVGHGDLSPDNILIYIDEDRLPHLKIIDYEELYVPGFSKPIITGEAGKTAFQHKSRHDGQVLDETVHYFSSIVYYLSLLVYSLQSNDKECVYATNNSLSEIDDQKLYDGIDGLKMLLFTADDLKSGDTKIFRKLKNIPYQDEIRELAKILEIYIHQDTTEHFQSLPYLIDMIRKQDPMKVYTYNMRPGSPIYRD